MLRWFLLGGRWGPVPWEFLVMIGSSMMGGAAVTLIVSAGARLNALSELAAAALALGGGATVLVGLSRRRREDRGGRSSGPGSPVR